MVAKLCARSFSSSMCVFFLQFLCFHLLIFAELTLHSSQNRIVLVLFTSLRWFMIHSPYRCIGTLCLYSLGDIDAQHKFCRRWFAFDLTIHILRLRWKQQQHVMHGKDLEDTEWKRNKAIVKSHNQTAFFIHIQHQSIVH